jgi:hypothetical protein
MGWAGVDGPDDLPAKEAAGPVVDQIGDLLPNLDQRRAVGGDLLLGGNVQVDPLQDRQVLHPSAAPVGGAPGLGRHGGLLLGQGIVGLGGLQGEMELLGVHLLRTAPEVLLHEGLHLGLHLAQLESEDAELLL